MEQTTHITQPGPLTRFVPMAVSEGIIRWEPFSAGVDDDLTIIGYQSGDVAALRLTLAQRNEQIDKLATYILASVPGEPSQNDGAVDTAIRVLTQQAQEIERLQKQYAIQKEVADNQTWHVQDLRKQLTTLTTQRDEAERREKQWETDYATDLSALRTERDEAVRKKEALWGCILEEMAENAKLFQVLGVEPEIKEGMSGTEAVTKAIQHLQATLAAREVDLARVDEILSRRPALADLPTRSEKIERAINVAKMADAAVQRAEQAEGRILEMEQQIKDLQQSIEAWRDT